LLQGIDPSHLVTDNNLGTGISGLDLARIIRNNGYLGKVFIHSANLDYGSDFEEVRKEGIVDDYGFKPKSFRAARQFLYQ